MDTESDLSIPQFLRRTPTAQESVMDTEPQQESLPEDTIKPIEEMSIEEAQRQLNILVEQRKKLEEAIPVFKQYIIKKTKAL